YPKGISLILICLGLFLAVLCTGLDRLILATAIPKITSEFSSLPDIGWYGSAYLLTSCCFQLMYGKLYAEYNVKSLFVVALLIFEVGSVLCAAAPSSPVLILGRAVAGLGSSGLLTGALTILAHISPLHNRPKMLGAVGSAIGIAQIVAPTLGGVFTDYATWRWCFWINLPIGGVTFLVVVFLVHLPSSAKAKKPSKEDAAAPPQSVWQKFDLLGTVFLVPALVCLLLALQWGGTAYPWNSWRVILTLTLFSVCFVVWGCIQYRAGDKATVPMRIVSMRSMQCAMWFIFCVTSVLFVVVNFVPLWFQAVKNVSAHQSGINFLATTVSLSVLAVLSGFLTSRIGYYVPQMIGCTVLVSVGAGLITRFGVDTSQGYWIGTLVLFGLGIGMGGQTPVMVPQTVLTGGDISRGTSVIIFAQTISGTIWVSVANTIFQDGIIAELAIHAPTANPNVVVAAGGNGFVEAMRRVYPDMVDQIVLSYSLALQRVWIIAVVLACVSTFGAVFQEWRSVKKK
ncbi:major facilitator superfamily domain-containing protein, partial [Bombardia bombarda]